MILYVNGDSHSAGAEAVNTYCFAEDDPNLRLSGRKPHPNNLAVSYGQLLADNLNYDLVCQAESASSNDRILRITREYLKFNTPDLIIIGWSTWEREEWFHGDQYWQINAGGVGQDWPKPIQDKYHDWVAGLNFKHTQEQAHEKIWAFHQELKGIPHLFFNTFSPFSYPNRKDWGNNYIAPYDVDNVYYRWLLSQGFQTVNPKSYHFGADAHQAWATHLTKILKDSIITK